MGKAIYWSQDSEQRHQYFESQFFSLAKRLARERGVSINIILSQIKDINSWIATLEDVFSLDSSLAFYVENMSNNDLEDFFQRNNIQKIVVGNQDNETILTEEEQEQIPLKVEQVKKKTREFFTVTTKGKRTRGYKDEVKRNGKKQKIFRNLKGQFAKRK